MIAPNKRIETLHQEEKRKTLPTRDEKWPKSHDKKKAIT
jgi:hypothetical protein